MMIGEPLYKVGDLVEFVDEYKHKDHPSQFPQVGTVGLVKSIDSDGDLWVLWPEGSVGIKGTCCTSQRRVVLAGSKFNHENLELDNLFSEMG